METGVSSTENELYHHIVAPHRPDAAKMKRDRRLLPSTVAAGVPVSAGQTEGGRTERSASFALHELAKVEESFPPCLELPLSLVLCPRSVGIEGILVAGVVREGVAKHCSMPVTYHVC